MTEHYCQDCNKYQSGCPKKISQSASTCKDFFPLLPAEGESGNLSLGGTKESNPKYSAGIKKAPLHCIPGGPLFELGLAMFEGSRKYGRHNYRAVGVRASTYYDAMIGHIMDWWEGEDIDPDSGLHHLVKATTAMFIIRDSMLMGNFNDDRPLRYPQKHGRSDYNDRVKKLMEKYPDCKEPFLETNKE